MKNDILYVSSYTSFSIYRWAKIILLSVKYETLTSAILLKIFWENLRNHVNLGKTENFDICLFLYIFFERQCQYITSVGKTGHWTMPWCRTRT